MASLPDHVAYWLPARAAGHRPRTAGVAASLAALDRLLVTMAAADATIDVRLDAHAAARWEDDAAADAALAQLVASLGEPSAVREHELVVEGLAPVLQRRVAWTAPAEALPALVALLGDARWPHGAHGPVALAWTRRFRWHDAADDAPLLPHDAADLVPASSFAVRVGRHVTVRPVLHFPFAEGDPLLDRFASRVAAALPFALQQRHFLLVGVTRDGTPRVRRLALPPALDRA
jgi:hypothetical protein